MSFATRGRLGGDSGGAVKLGPGLSFSWSRLIKNLICIRRIFLLLILISLVVFSLSYSLEIMLNGREYVEGDTYSTPFTNILGSIIMVLTIIIAWRWKPKKKP